MKPTQPAATNLRASGTVLDSGQGKDKLSCVHPAAGCLLAKESPLVSPSPTERDRPLQLSRARGAPEQAAHPGEEAQEEMVSWGGQMPTCSPTTYSEPSSRTHTCNSPPLKMLGLVLLDHGHLNMSSKTCKIWADAVPMAPSWWVGNAREMKG